MAITLVQQNKKLVKEIKAEIQRLHAQPLDCEVNSMGVIQVFDNQEADVISTQVAAEWLRLLKLAPADFAEDDGFERAWQALNEAQDKFGYGGTHTMNPGAGKDARRT